jgi:signal peptidase II
MKPSLCYRALGRGSTGRRHILAPVPVLPLALAAVWVALDQLLKVYTVANIPFGDMRTIVPGFLTLTHLQNTGAAWSLFEGSAVPLALFRAVVAAGVVWYLVRHRHLPGIQKVALALIAAGAIGNAVDGLLRGHVVDMLVLHPLNWIYQPIFNSIFPPFNLADTGIVSGVVLLLIASFLPEPKRGRIRI